MVFRGFGGIRRWPKSPQLDVSRREAASGGVQGGADRPGLSPLGGLGGEIYKHVENMWKTCGKPNM